MYTKPGLNERDERFAKVRAAMEKEGLEALVIAGKGHWWTGRGYFRYLTDFHLWAHDGLILFPLEGEPVLTLTSAAVARRIGERGWITGVHGDPDIAPTIVEAVSELGLETATIGIAGRRFILSAGTHDILTEGLPDAAFVQADALLDRVRMVKSELEIRQNRELWNLAKDAMNRFVEVLEPGKSELELTGEAIKVLAAGGARDYLVFFNGDPPESVPAATDDVLGYHMETCGPSGHWCEITVTCAFRDPTERELRLMNSELRALDEICRVARPGVKIGELSTIFERVLREDGWELSANQPSHYDFHGQGMDCIEHPVYGPLDSRSDVALEAGMVLSYHPRRKVVPPVRSMGISDDILITVDGAERLSGDWDLRWRRCERS
jgi:Xaa-Pro aminopeptidase